MLNKVFLHALLIALIVGHHPAFAADERYDYDELGRLIRVVPTDVTSSSYFYDAAGNLLHVQSDAQLAPPTVPDLGFDSLRCASEMEVVLVGENLNGVRITASSSAIEVYNVRYTDEGVSFTLRIHCDAAGEQALYFTMAGGTTIVPLQITPSLPQVYVTPAPLAVPPDGSIRPFTLRLSHPDSVTHEFQISSLNAALQVSTASLVIPAGSTQANGQLRGLQPGQAFLDIASTTLGNTRVPVFITDDFAGVNTSYASLLGLFRVPESPSPEDRFVEFAGAQVGVNTGQSITGIEPSVVLVGADAVPIRVSGIGLERATSVAILPADGLVMGEVSIEENDLVFPLSVNDDAAPSLRRVVVTRDNGTTYFPAAPFADRLRIALPAPVIDSVSPVVLYPGDTSVALAIRGRRLDDVRSINVEPDDDITVGQTFTTNADGTLLTTRISLAPDTTTGSRVVTVTTAGGTSDPTPTPGNTLHVVVDNVMEVPVLAGAILGVMKDEPTHSQERDIGLQSSAVGLITDAAITGIEPAAGIAGTGTTLTIQGHGLTSANSVTFNPPDGITVSSPVVAPDGRSISLELTIAQDASLTTREIRVAGASGTVPPVTSEANRFAIVLPPPVMHSVSPLHLLPGEPNTTIRIGGENLREGSVRFIPSEGIITGSVSVTPDGAVLTAQVAVSTVAPIGARVVEVVTASGSSGLAPTPQNTVQIVAEPGPTYPSLSAVSVGVTRPHVEAEPDPELTTVASASLGVDRQRPDEAVERNFTPIATALRIAKGPMGYAITPDAALPGEVLDIVVSGHDLDEVTNVAFEPGEGLTIQQTPVVGPDGDELHFNVAVSADALPQAHRVVLQAADGTPLLFANPRASQFRVGHAAPEILSIEPILAGRGDAMTLLIRGRNLFNAFVVAAEPAQGLRFSPYISVNAEGTELTVNMSVDADAPLGARVIRVAVPGAVSTGNAAPANTFTVFESVPQ
ncbi:MAG TPA: RHS repeat domain-containing protein [Gammaproteobacteria bacterium]